jgi:RNA polymerase sigma factor (sigma-70 family)
MLPTNFYGIKLKFRKMITNIDLKSITECKDFTTFPELFQAIARKLTKGDKCLMSLGWKKILPMLRKQNLLVNEGILEESMMDGVTAIICGLIALKPYKIYTWDEASIGLLLRICKNKVIDKTSRDPNEDWGQTEKVEDWEEYNNRTNNLESYCTFTTFHDEENPITKRELFLYTLTEREREIYILHYEEGKTVAEISKLLGISPATVYRELENIEIKKEIFKEKIRQGEL